MSRGWGGLVAKTKRDECMLSFFADRVNAEEQWRWPLISRLRDDPSWRFFGGLIKYEYRVGRLLLPTSDSLDIDARLPQVLSEYGSIARAMLPQTTDEVLSGLHRESHKGGLQQGKS